MNVMIVHVAVIASAAAVHWRNMKLQKTEEINHVDVAVQVRGIVLHVVKVHMSIGRAVDRGNGLLARA